MKKNLFFFIILLSAFKSFSQVLINEYSCSNISTTLDAFNNYEDWVELYNNGSAAVNLTGYYLSNDKNNLQMWAIPTATPITPGGRKMIYCSNNNLVHLGTGQIHPKFKLRQTYGQWFILSDPSGNVVDSIKLQLTQRNHSRSRLSDASPTWGIDNSPTPNAANNTIATSYATNPIFSVNAGFYSSTQNVSITSPDPNVTIHYTLNGTLPTATSATYTTPLVIAATTAVRAIAISTNPVVLPSFVETNTYLINEATNFATICVSGAYTPATGNPNCLFSWSATPAWSSFEYFDQNHNFVLETEGQSSKHGNDSWAYAQKGFDFEASDESGVMGSLNNKLFRSTLRDTFDRIILKAGASDNYPLGPNNSCHLRDVFAQTLAEKYQLDMDFRRFEGANLFVNGQYWGVYDLRERVDQGDFAYYYGQTNSKKIDHLSYWGGLTIRLGSDSGWVNLYNYIINNNMAVPANYAHVKQYLNTTSFIQYFIFNTYLVNHDWLNWNTMWWRGNKSPGVKWRYALWDEDAICGLDNPNYTNVATTSAYANPCEAPTLQLDSNVKHTIMLSRLLMNPEFEQNYKDEWLHLFNTAFDCTNIRNHFDSIVNLFTPDMPRQIARWGGSMTQWNANVDSMRAFLDLRCAVIGSGLDSCLDLNPQQLKLNVMPPGSGTIALNGSTKSPYIWSKVIQGDSTYTLKATKTGGQYWSFDHWEKQKAVNTFNPNATTDLIQFDFKDKDSVIAYFKYFNYDSVDVTFDVTPPGTGTISLNGNTFSSYPTTLTLDRRNTYNIVANPITDYKLLTWQKNNANTTIAPSLTNRVATLNYFDNETVVANFEYVPPPPPLPTLAGIDKSYFIPNAFTPNGDGNNDVFNITLSKDAIGLDISLFDRWGNVVFTSNKADKGWNGKFKGKDCEMGTYQYIIKVRFRDNSVESYKGDFTLIR